MGILGSTDTDYIFVKICRYRSLTRLILLMSSNYSLYLACIKLDGLATYYHVAKLPQHFYTLKLVNYDNIYNCYSNLKLI